ncbi:TD and POZ domain-containing protein 1-like [Stegodyphus dumicola]|uniref:TD and POZ domain-containing protein 1-like n=1 Tax=Stegodyphus dumicola TaxID=202533 RepID=UPI0015A83937|nr:TD and POZ domain-containing protein 1-like [Stegodyphus dumicola]
MSDLDKLFVFKWIVKNFSFIRPDRSNPLCSSHFNVKAYGTACIDLYPEGDLLSEKCLLLEIKIPDELENVTIDCELSGYDLHGKALEFSKTETSYRKVWKFKRVSDDKKVSETSAGSSEKISLETSPETLIRPARFRWPPEKRDETKKTVSDDTVIITCIFYQLKVPLEGNKNSLKIMYDIYDVEHLSQDFSLLLQSSQCSDLLLCAGNEIFHVHKAILWARAPKFLNDFSLQNWKVSAEPVKVALDPPVLRLLLQYLYSGKLKTDKAEYLASLCRIADKYDLVDLKQKLYVFPSEVSITTNIKVDRKSFIWPVNLKSPAEKFYSPTFRSGCIPGSEFQLILSVQKVSRGSRNVEVCVRRLFPDKENPVLIHLMISIVGGGDKHRLPDTKKHYFLADEEWCYTCVIQEPVHNSQHKEKWLKLGKDDWQTKIPSFRQSFLH